MMRKKFKKKITAVAVGVVICAVNCIPVLADYVHEIGWDSDPCPRCKEETAVWVREVHKPASPTGNQVLCTHHRFGVDIEWEGRIVTEYECREEGCQYSWSEESRPIYWECQGYDNPREDGEN